MAKGVKLCAQLELNIAGVSLRTVYNVKTINICKYTQPGSGGTIRMERTHSFPNELYGKRQSYSIQLFQVVPTTGFVGISS